MSLEPSRNKAGGAPFAAVAPDSLKARLQRPVPGGVFFARHTAGFALGVVLVMVLHSLMLGRGPRMEFLNEVPLMLALFGAWSLVLAALFSLGAGWGGQPRLRSVAMAFLAGLLFEGGFYLLAELLELLFPPGAPLRAGFPPEPHRFHSAWMTVYIIVSPVVAGIAAALLERRNWPRRRSRA